MMLSSEKHTCTTRRMPAMAINDNNANSGCSSGKSINMKFDTSLNRRNDLYLQHITKRFFLRPINCSTFFFWQITRARSRLRWCQQKTKKEMLTNTLAHSVYLQIICKITVMSISEHLTLIRAHVLHFFFFVEIIFQAFAKFRSTLMDTLLNYSVRWASDPLFSSRIAKRILLHKMSFNAPEIQLIFNILQSKQSTIPVYIGHRNIERSNSLNRIAMVLCAIVCFREIAMLIRERKRERETLVSN